MKPSPPTADPSGRETLEISIFCKRDLTTNLLKKWLPD